MALELDWDRVETLIREGYISRRQHPRLPLLVLNYTAKAQFHAFWCEETETCRGLVVDTERRIVARGLRKFFNWDELAVLGRTPPEEPWDYTEKLDGSLIHIFLWQDEMVFASRGSFDGPHVGWAEAIWQAQYRRIDLKPGLTYCCELIHPANRIVVDYGERRDLVLLATFETATGKEIYPPVDVGLPQPVRGRGTTIDALIEGPADNHEGYVVRFDPSGFRVKIKYPEYLRLHRLLTQTSPKHIWELLRSGDSLASLQDRVPPAFTAWVSRVGTQLVEDYQRIEELCRSQFEARPKSAERKEIALYFQQCAHPHILFSMLDSKDYGDAIWKLLRPTSDERFAQDEP